jgi:FKBP-type peptidyl-prolyl cis-trans isomerase
MQKRPLFLLIAALGGAACTSLTSPPEPIAADTTGLTPQAGTPGTATLNAAAPKPAASANARPAGAQPAPTMTAPVLQAAAKGDDKLGIQDLVPGKGQEAKAGDTVSVHYTGTLASNGTEFDSSKKHGQPFTFPLGQGRVIKGWDQGVAGMKVGGKRKLTIPPSLGYGDHGAGPIPPNSTLVFEIELLEIKK